jgi:hypothetical protein
MEMIMKKMKKLTTTTLLLAAVLIIGAGGCETTSSTGGGQIAASTRVPAERASAPTERASAPTEQTSLYTGNGGKSISLAILAPKAEGLNDTQSYIPALVQGEFVSNFTGYSAISVLDREHLDEQYAEIFSGYYDDDAEAGNDLGHLIPSDYIMGGSIIKTASGYALQMRVTKTNDKTTLCSYSGTCTFAELDNLTGVRRASLDILGKMGVQLTARTRNELSGAAMTREVQSQTALAQGVTAQRSGTVVEALSYYFQAASYDASLTEAASRVNILTANITSGNMGENIRNDIQWRDQWRARLAEAEQVYANYVRQQPIYSLVYDVNLKHGETNYSANTVPISGVTIDLVPDAAWFNTAISVVRVVNVVREGLLATKQVGKWGMDWPRYTMGNSPFGNRDQNFGVVVELVNSNGKVIGKEQITMRSGYEVEWSEGTLRRLIPRLQGVQSLGFSRVNAYDITTNMAVRIASIDGVDAETAAKTKGINILREAEYARLPDVIAGVDSHAVARFMRDIEMDPSGVITGYKGAGGKLVIPASVFGLPVTAIGKNAFATVEVKYNTLSDGSRHPYQIYSGKGLTNVIIPNSVTRIGENAFINNRINNIVIPNSVITIGENAFRNNNISNIVIPDSVTTISAEAFFADNYYLESIYHRGNSGSYSNPLISITLPSNVTLGGNDIFKNGAFGDTHGFFYNNAIASFYNRNGKKAGTYTRPNIKSRKWTYHP